MPSAEEILQARDAEGVPADEPSKIETDYPEQKPSHDRDDGEEPAPRREPGEPRPEPDSDDASSKMVPQQALHAEREKSKRYTEEVRDLHQKIAELTSIVQRAQQPPPPQPEPQKPPEFDWDNPVGTVDQRIQTQVEQRIAQERAAIAAEFQRQREELQSNIAITRHGEEVVKSAYAALAEARETDPQWGTDYQRIMRSPNQYEAMVAWHKERQFKAEVGPDPEAYKARIRAEYLQELRNGKVTDDEPREAAARSAGTVMPSNLSSARSVGSRNGVAWQGPTPLKDIFANR
jgi:methylphosphotriester-DNA--protein-cysteine methyltransferase